MWAKCGLDINTSAGVPCCPSGKKDQFQTLVTVKVPKIQTYRNMSAEVHEGNAVISFVAEGCAAP
jgi:hypothetical protein